MDIDNGLQPVSVARLNIRSFGDIPSYDRRNTLVLVFTTEDFKLPLFENRTILIIGSVKNKV